MGVGGWAGVVVDASDRAAGEVLAGLDTAALPAVVVVVARDPGCPCSTSLPTATRPGARHHHRRTSAAGWLGRAA
jgi:hypothetical protein